MEKMHEAERFEEEQSTPLDVSKLTPEQIQRGINGNLENMVKEFTLKLLVLEELIGRQVDVKVRAELKDGRKVSITIKSNK